MQRRIVNTTKTRAMKSSSVVNTTLASGTPRVCTAVVTVESRGWQRERGASVARGVGSGGNISEIGTNTVLYMTVWCIVEFLCRREMLLPRHRMNLRYVGRRLRGKLAVESIPHDLCLDWVFPTYHGYFHWSLSLSFSSFRSSFFPFSRSESLWKILNTSQLRDHHQVVKSFVFLKLLLYGATIRDLFFLQ